MKFPSILPPPSLSPSLPPLFPSRSPQKGDHHFSLMIIERKQKLDIDLHHHWKK